MRLRRNTKKIIYYLMFAGVCVFFYMQFTGTGPDNLFNKQSVNVVRENKDPSVHERKDPEVDPNRVVGPKPGIENEEVPVAQVPPQQKEEANVVKEKKYGPLTYLTPDRRGNYEPPEWPAVHGPGEGGVPVYTTLEEKAAVDRALMYDGFNMPASNKIAMNRSIPDSRLEECKHWQYPPADQLPSASVVVIFYDEGLSPLLRTIHTIIDRTDPAVLKEVVMVDDFSERKEFQPPDGYLYKYCKEHFGDKVVIYRTPKREGLIRARNFGAEKSVGDVVVFLDAHCECNRNWLVPMLARIAYDRTILAVPIVDMIDGNTFRYTPYSINTHNRGIFEWGFFYKENAVPERELKKRKHNSEPYWAPTHAGGLLAIDRKYFFEMGGYDPGLKIWGGENFELAFKIWQCGGSSEWVPCSRVGHVYRAGQRAAFKSGIKDSHRFPLAHMNYKRVVEVWFDDEYKEYFYRMLPEIRKVDVGDLSAQFAIKKRYNCKSFKWFIENIAYEIPERYPYPPPNIGWGEIANEDNICFDNPRDPVIGAYVCHRYGGSQMFRFNTKGQIARGERMVEADGSGKLYIKMSGGSQSGPWEYKKDTKAIHHTIRKKCVESVGHDMMLKDCDPSETAQRWEINEVHPWKHVYEKN